MHMVGKSTQSNIKAFVIGGTRTPFMRSGGKFFQMMSHELGNYAINGLINKLGIDPTSIEYVCMGTVLSDPNTSNVAREIVLESLLSKSTPAHTVTMACISSNIAATTVANMIELGQISGGIAGGVETFSDLPIRLSKKLRKLLIHTKMAKGLSQTLKLWSKFKLRDLRPDIPSPKEFSTGFTMGQAGDQLAAQFGVSRAEADQYALLSHERAGTAWKAGYYDDQVVSVDAPPQFDTVQKDDGPRPDSTPQMVAALKPAFGELGINTAANSSFFADGGSAILLGNASFCQKHGLKPLAIIKDFFYAAGDPLHELLLGPALTVPHLLRKNQLQVSDIDVWEIHEAFAGQVLAILRAMHSKTFCKERLGLSNALPQIPLDKVNLWGGSLSLGHPFGATGTRLILTAAQRLVKENGRLAIVTGCAASGLGSALLLQRD
jgi:acetyl-CoA acetyltransferase family protein